MKNIILSLSRPRSFEALRQPQAFWRSGRFFQYDVVKCSEMTSPLCYDMVPGLVAGFLPPIILLGQP